MRVWIVVLFTMTSVENVFTYAKKEKAVDKYISLANSYFDRTEEFVTEDDVNEYINSEEFCDKNYTVSMQLIDSVVEGI